MKNHDKDYLLLSACRWQQETDEENDAVEISTSFHHCLVQMWGFLVFSIVGV